MARNETGQLCRLQALTRIQSEEVPEAALQAFDEAAQLMERAGASERQAITVSGEAFRALTGFSPAAGEFISPEAVRRSAEAATPARINALGNARTSLRADYLVLGVFLPVCAMHGLGLKADLLAARRQR